MTLETSRVAMDEDCGEGAVEEEDDSAEEEDEELLVVMDEEANALIRVTISSYIPVFNGVVPSEVANEID